MRHSERASERRRRHSAAFAQSGGGGAHFTSSLICIFIRLCVCVRCVYLSYKILEQSGSLLVCRPRDKNAQNILVFLLTATEAAHAGQRYLLELQNAAVIFLITEFESMLIFPMGLCRGLLSPLSLIPVVCNVIICI